jgi:hypothetical protein
MTASKNQIPKRTPQESKRAAVYIRLSTKDQEEMYGEELQLDKIMKFIDSRADLVFA